MGEGHVGCGQVAWLQSSLEPYSVYTAAYTAPLGGVCVGTVAGEALVVSCVDLLWSCSCEPSSSFSTLLPGKGTFCFEAEWPIQLGVPERSAFSTDGSAAWQPLSPGCLWNNT